LEANGDAEAGVPAVLLVGCAVGAGADEDAAGLAEGVVWGCGVVGDWVLRGRAWDGVRAGGLTAAALVSLASAASARFTVDSVSCWLVFVAMPWPSRETASKLPAVAAPTPRSQAPTPAATRMCTWPRVTHAWLRAGKTVPKAVAPTAPGWPIWGLPPGKSRYRHVVAQLLLVEDDAAIRGALIRALTERGHAVTSRPSAMAALQQVLDSPPDLILLDLGLPDLSGYEALRMMRAVTSVPVVVVTARDDEAEIIRVLDAGADDYVVKPFGAGQIDARIRAVLRRAGGADPGAAGSLEVGGLRLDPDAYEATLDAAPLDLSRREFDLLHYLALHAGQVVTRRDLLTHVWRMPYGGADKTVDVHVSWLRRKLGETAQHPRYLHTVRGVGIKLSPPP